MTRRIIAIGGGGFLMERQPSLLDEYFVRAAGARSPKVCFISTGAGDPEEWLAKYYKAFPSWVVGHRISPSSANRAAVPSR